jgi:hypothetical protein
MSAERIKLLIMTAVVLLEELVDWITRCGEREGDDYDEKS